jgi:hypothetical protein
MSSHQTLSPAFIRALIKDKGVCCLYMNAECSSRQFLAAHGHHTLHPPATHDQHCTRHHSLYVTFLLLLPLIEAGLLCATRNISYNIARIWNLTPIIEGRAQGSDIGSRERSRIGNKPPGWSARVVFVWCRGSNHVYGGDTSTATSNADVRRSGCCSRRTSGGYFCSNRECSKVSPSYLKRFITNRFVDCCKEEQRHGSRHFLEYSGISQRPTYTRSIPSASRNPRKTSRTFSAWEKASGKHGKASDGSWPVMLLVMGSSLRRLTCRGEPDSPSRHGSRR